MKKYYIYMNSCAAPFFSDSSHKFVEAAAPEDALEEAIKNYDHPCGLFSAAVYNSSDDYLQGKKALITWKSQKAYKQGY